MIAAATHCYHANRVQTASVTDSVAVSVTVTAIMYALVTVIMTIIVIVNEMLPTYNRDYISSV